MEIIKLEGITKVYRTTEVETTALENVNLTVRKGEFLSIMGPSGCGKSTLLNLMGLLDLPDQGKIPVSYTHLKSVVCDIFTAVVDVSVVNQC